MSSWEEHRDHAVGWIIFDPGLDRHAHLFVLPPLNALSAADKNCNCLGIVKRILHLLLHRLARLAMPGTEPEGQPGIAKKLPGNPFDKILRLRAVTQKN